MTTRLRSGAGARKNYRKMAGLKTRATKKVATLTKPVARAVQRIVSRNLETKYITTGVENAVFHNSAIGPADQYRVLPNIAAGVSEFQRVGDRIRPKSLTVKGQVSMYTPTPNNKPIMVRILILQLKAARYWPNAVNVWNSGASNVLLKINDDVTAAENIPYNGDYNSNFLPVNREAFDVLGERFIKLDGHKDGSVESVTPGALARTFNIPIKKCPKVLKYTGQAAVAPENFAPFMAVGYAYMDGTGADTISTNIVVSAQSHLYFTDA